MLSRLDPSRSPSWSSRGYRLLRRWRRTAIALLLCLAVVLIEERLTPASTATTRIVAAGVDLPLGTVLSAEDLHVLEVPLLPDISPPAAEAVKEDFIGATLAVPVNRGQEIRQNLLAGQHLLAGMEPGVSAVPLRLADPGSARLLSAGQPVDVFITSTGMSGTTLIDPGGGADASAPNDGPEHPGSTKEAALPPLASAVPVLWVQQSGAANTPWSGSGDEGLIVVAADATQARRLATTPGRVSVVLVSSP
ncbi:SAF domain-containing protein [Acaricomes phytoseiuli]|uniref:SAF domain-containing protein n=1 Tax=Acaricomes phytoseiuli TaxID=291968 RepID=UPI00037BA877|nr:SAF domain-containing protein [Acaricomes phytoseiuli]MCW1250095.1 SAF domain-containing protein [Acaricomes phytoseiuli]